MVSEMSLQHNSTHRGKLPGVLLQKPFHLLVLLNDHIRINGTKSFLVPHTHKAPVCISVKTVMAVRFAASSGCLLNLLGLGLLVFLLLSVRLLILLSQGLNQSWVRILNLVSPPAPEV